MTSTPTSPGQAGRASPWNLANALTVLRVVLVPVFAWLLLREGGDDTASRIAAFVTFGVAAVTDKADGEIARRRGLVTDFGKLADPIADKALIGTALAGLSLLGELPWWVTILVLTRELGITILRFWVIRYGVIAASGGGKAKTLLQVVAIGLYLLPLTGFGHRVAVVVMTAAVVLTVSTGVDYVVRAIRMRMRGPATDSGPSPGDRPAASSGSARNDRSAESNGPATDSGSASGEDGPDRSEPAGGGTS